MTNQEIQEQAEKYTIDRGADKDKKAFRIITNRDLYDHTIECFEAGAKWMQEQDKWISVDVKPDKEFTDILLYFGGEDYSCSGYYVKNENVFMSHNVMYRGLKATHWQNLPKPPKTK